MPGDAGVDTEKQLKYPLPDVSQHSIEEYLSHDELALIAGDPDDVEFNLLPAPQKERYDKFVEALAQKQSGMPGVAELIAAGNPFAGEQRNSSRRRRRRRRRRRPRLQVLL